MKIKEQTRKLAVGCSKHCFEVADRTDEVSNHIYGKATLTRFEFDFRRVLLSMLQELIDMVYFFSFSFIENSPDDEVDNRKLDNELEIEDPVEGEPTC